MGRDRERFVKKKEKKELISCFLGCYREAIVETALSILGCVAELH